MTNVDMDDFNDESFLELGLNFYEDLSADSQNSNSPNYYSGIASPRLASPLQINRRHLKMN
jgi:hypothetical protein